MELVVRHGAQRSAVVLDATSLRCVAHYELGVGSGNELMGTSEATPGLQGDAEPPRGVVIQA